MAFIEMRKVKKTYVMGTNKINAVDGVNLSIEKGDFCVVVGPSGAGKTTVLNLLGGMDTVTSGTVKLDGKTISKMNAKQLTEYRRHDVGFVFQFYNLVQNLTALENVELAVEICKNPLDPKKTLELVGLGDRIKNFPSRLSGGEQQRVSIARAIAKNPKILLCDEPTGALDFTTGKSVLALLQKICRETGKTVIIITHNQELTKMADRVFSMRNGKVIYEAINDNPTPVEELVW
ncbi:MAG: ABC transporter ATP-binding protein [Clostridia bacterium]|nr:ABC transporter ATP-binding protein [Clostridia bacterium]